MGTSPGLSPCRPPRSGSLPPGEEVAPLRTQVTGAARLSSLSEIATTLLPRESLSGTSGREGLGRSPGAGEVNAAKGVHLCFALHGDRGEQGEQRRKRLRAEIVALGPLPRGSPGEQGLS